MLNRLPAAIFLLVHFVSLSSGFPQRGIIGEVDKATVNITSTTAVFKVCYDKPVVVAKPLTLSESDPAVVRISNLNVSSFDIRLQEYSTTDGVHADEDVSYIVMEQGRWNLSGFEKAAEAGRDIMLTNNQNITFSSPFTTVPAVFGALLTSNDNDASVVRIYDVTATGFKVERFEDTGGDGVLSQEEFGFIAIERGVGFIGQLNDVPFEVQYLANAARFDENCKSIHFVHGSIEPEFSEVPLVVADLLTVNQISQPSNLRICNLDRWTTDIRVQDQTFVSGRSAEGIALAGFEKTALIPHLNLIVGFVIDGSGSMDPLTEFGVLRDGINLVIDYMPLDGSVALTVVQFCTNGGGDPSRKISNYS